MVPDDRFSQPVTGAVTIAVADAKGVEPTDLELILHEHIDVDALESLTDHERSSWTLTFELPEHTVTVTNGGVVFVDGDVELVPE